MNNELLAIGIEEILKRTTEILNNQRFKHKKKPISMIKALKVMDLLNSTEIK